MPVLGVVENMAGITCPHCHGEFHLFPRDALAQRLEEAGVASLTCIPLDPELARGSDVGVPDVLARPDGGLPAEHHDAMCQQLKELLGVEQQRLSGTVGTPL